jgi:hypothetical protein
MKNYTNQAPTQFTEVAGIRFAYRRFGKKGGVPMLCFMLMLYPDSNHGAQCQYPGCLCSMSRSSRGPEREQKKDIEK